MADVALRAGVSEMTVSRVLNGAANVRTETRERVLRAMRESGYSPNLAARALVTGRSGTIGVVTVDSSLYGPASTLLGLERAARETGYFVSIASLSSLTQDSLLGAIARLRQQGVDGILIIAPHVSAERALATISDDLPMVAIESDLSGSLPVVGVDQQAGARMATQFLLDLGHATVWHVAGPENWFDARARRQSWRATLEAAGIEAPPVLEGDWSARSGYELGRRMLRTAKATAVFAANDHMALGLLRALQEGGVRTPEQVSVVGFDDVPEAEYFSPPLTTVHQDFDELGKRGMRELTRQMQGGRPEEPVSISPQLVVRHSTGPDARRRSASRRR
jgi:DNA-binding LacI/PurR family transcriptional regulator